MHTQFPCRCNQSECVVLSLNVNQNDYSFIVETCCLLADGTEEVYEADDWDRSPVPVAEKLTYGEMLELKALQCDLYLAPQPSTPSAVPLPRVPIPLLRLNP
ncbi:hypothetical protein EV363DRAFT_862682 [Boletus edulis]|nr:hypothetical protein EV363DRAFT_862682 [Boletus edulis]